MAKVFINLPCHLPNKKHNKTNSIDVSIMWWQNAIMYLCCPCQRIYQSILTCIFFLSASLWYHNITVSRILRHSPPAPIHALYYLYIFFAIAMMRWQKSVMLWKSIQIWSSRWNILSRWYRNIYLHSMFVCFVGFIFWGQIFQYTINKIYCVLCLFVFYMAFY